MQYSGKFKTFDHDGRTLRLYNQSCREWTHPYNNPAYPSEALDDMHAAGCGIFAIAHLIDYITGTKIDVEELADFSMREGGRGDDGTDRPALLAAMQKHERLSRFGLSYHCDGLLNGSDLLWNHMQNNGAALGNLRVGHIVAIVDSRIVNGEKQLLIIDSSRDCIHSNVCGEVRECVSGSEFLNEYVNDAGIHTGMCEHSAMFWIPYTKPFNFNLIHRI